MGLPFSGGSPRSRSMDRGSKLLVYQQEQINGSMAVLLNDLKLDQGVQFKMDITSVVQCLMNRGSSYSLPLLKTDCILTLAALKIQCIQVLFTWRLPCLGRCPIKVKDYVIKTTLGTSALVDHIIRSESVCHKGQSLPFHVCLSSF